MPVMFATLRDGGHFALRRLLKYVQKASTNHGFVED
jgi:hypothetical protein